MAKSVKKIISLFMCFLMVLSCLNGFVFEGIGNIVVKALDNASIAGDINGDGKVNNKDLTRLIRYMAGEDVEIFSAVTDANGDGVMNDDDIDHLMRYMVGESVEIHVAGCVHKIAVVKAVESTCSEEGNIEHWQCSLCNKRFSDKDGKVEIAVKDTVVALKEHTAVIDPAKVPTKTETGLTEGSHCSVCNKVLVPQEVLPVISGYSITYNIATGSSSSYIAGQGLDLTIPVEKRQYSSDKGLAELPELTLDGYQFLGWYNAPPENANAVQVTKIDAGSTANYTLYAHWYEYTYDITYKLYQTPLGPIEGEKYLHYTVSKGLVDLPNPELHNYVFLGWYNDDGNEVTEIPVGSTGDITLNAHWTSKRNLTKAVKTLEDPIIMENSDDGVIYFAYEIGTIENVPLSEAYWTIQSVAGLSQQKSDEYTRTISEENAQAISKTISNTTVDSASWSLSSDWNDVVEVNEVWAEQNGMTQEEANSKTKTTSGTYSVCDSNGGVKTTTKTDGTTTVEYDSQNYTHGNSAHFDAKINASYSSEANASLNIGGRLGSDDKNVTAGIGLGGKKTFEIGGELSGGYEQHQETTEHTGTDTTTVDTTVVTGTTNWNSSSTSSSTKSASESESYKQAISQVISNTKGYGKSYSTGGENSEAQGFSSTDSESSNTSSTLTYFTSETKKTTTTYSTDGKHEGCYRLVLAGTIHVFGIVGYDVASKSYFAYTYNVLDDKTYEFLDYSPTLNFNDYENGVLPFEVPYFVYEYVAGKTVMTSGLKFKTNTSNGTATLIGYDGTDTDVTIPSYITSGNAAYKVTGLAASAFAGKNVRAVVLSDYIDELPAGAFKDCTKLEEISGYFSIIGDEAFSGCTSLGNYNVPSGVTEIGKDAFDGIDNLYVMAVDKNSALKAAKKQNPDAEEGSAVLTEAVLTITQNLIDSAVNSGAKNVAIDLSLIAEDISLTIEVPEIDSFELFGGLKTYKDLRLSSSAIKTSIKEITVKNSSGVPFSISSETVNFDAVKAEATGFVLLLSADKPTVSLTRDSRFDSVDKKAVVWSNPSIESIDFENAVGTLDISGDVYICGTISGMDYLTVTDGALRYITEDEFAKYIKGVYSVTFDVNGGVGDFSAKEVFYGSAVGELPEPKKDYFTFDGWYTEEDTKVTAETILTEAKDIELIAHWKENAVSDWVKASEMPADAQLVDTKWTYDHKITSSNSSVDGYTLYDTTSAWGEYGAWSSWSTTQAYSSDSRQIESKTVTDRAGYTNYKYWVFRTPDGWGYGTQNYYTGDSHGSCTKYDEINLSYALPVHNSSLGTYGPYNSGMFSHSGDSYWFSGGSSWVPAVTHTEYRYRDRSLVYTYYLISNEPLESKTEVTESSSISNVNKLVQYRAK